MNRRFLRRLAIGLIALLAFAQASVVLAACFMDRGSMAQSMAMPPDMPCNCGGSNTQVPVSASCVAHCTADLQLSGLPVALVRGPADAPVLVVPRVEPRFLSGAGFEVPRSPAVPSRILLHSFLI